MLGTWDERLTKIASTLISYVHPDGLLRSKAYSGRARWMLGFLLLWRRLRNLGPKFPAPRDPHASCNARRRASLSADFDLAQAVAKWRSRECRTPLVQKLLDPADIVGDAYSRQLWRFISASDKHFSELAMFNAGFYIRVRCFDKAA